VGKPQLAVRESLSRAPSLCLSFEFHPLLSSLLLLLTSPSPHPQTPINHHPTISPLSSLTSSKQPNATHLRTTRSSTQSSKLQTQSTHQNQQFTLGNIHRELLCVLIVAQRSDSFPLHRNLHGRQFRLIELHTKMMREGM
jgi:hypothetical protein